MRRALISRVAVAALVTGLPAGIWLASGSVANATIVQRQHTVVGSALGTIDDNGAISATVNGKDLKGATSTATVTGQIAPNAGVGVFSARGTMIMGSGGTPGSFTTSFSSMRLAQPMVVGSPPALTGTLAGSVSPTNGSSTTAMTYFIRCVASYPPLRLSCSVTIGYYSSIS